MSSTDFDFKISKQSVVEQLLEIGLNEFEADLQEDAKRSFLKGLTYDPANISLLSALTICFGVSNFAKKLFEISKSITQEEKDVLERIAFVNPNIVKNLYNTYLYFNDFDRLTYLESNYYSILCDYVFVLFKTLGKSALNKRIYLAGRFPEIITYDVLFDEYIFLDDKEYVSSLIALGVSVNDVFKKMLQKNQPINFYQGKVIFTTRALRLDTLEFYLQFGLNLKGINLKIKEEYAEWDDGFCSTVAIIERELDFYSFFKKFEQGKYFHTVERNGYLYSGFVEYSFNKCGCENASYIDYIHLLKKYGCI